MVGCREVSSGVLGAEAGTGQRLGCSGDQPGLSLPSLWLRVPVGSRGVPGCWVQTLGGHCYCSFHGRKGDGDPGVSSQVPLSDALEGVQACFPAPAPHLH